MLQWRGRVQIWQPCRKFFGKWPKKFCSKSEITLKKYFFREKKFIQSVLLDREVAALTKLPEIFQSKSKILPFNSWKYVKILIFLSQKKLSQNVPLDTWNAVSTSLPTIVSQNSRKCFAQAIERFKKQKQNFCEEICSQTSLPDS